MPFRMWLYPVPCWIAFAGWSFIFGSKLIGQITNPWYKQEALLGVLVMANGRGDLLDLDAPGRGTGPFRRAPLASARVEGGADHGRENVTSWPSFVSLTPGQSLVIPQATRLGLAVIRGGSKGGGRGCYT